MTATHIAHISDPHIVGPGTVLGGAVDTGAYLRAAVAHINATGGVDAVLVTGDLTNDGAPTQYTELVSILDGLDAPWHAIIGNHDLEAAAAAALGTHLPSGGPRAGCGTITVGDTTIVTLTSARAGEHGGTLDAADLSWLDTTLADTVGGPTLVALHHPPVGVGLAVMDTIILDAASSEALAEIVSQHRVDAVLCGHLHRMTVSLFGGTVAISAPGTAHAVAFDLDDDAPLACSLEHPGMLLHRIAGGRLTTHLSLIGPYPTQVVSL